jgi:hypothetical protein
MVGAVDIAGTKIAVGIVDAAAEYCLAWNQLLTGMGRTRSTLDRTVAMLRSAVVSTGATCSFAPSSGRGLEMCLAFGHFVFVYRMFRGPASS